MQPEIVYGYSDLAQLQYGPLPCKKAVFDFQVLWANSHSVCTGVSVIHAWANLSLELTTTRALCRAAQKDDQSCPPMSHSSPIIFEQRIEETIHLDPTQTCLRDVSQQSKENNLASPTVFHLIFFLHLAACQFTSITASPSHMLLPYSPPASMWYTSHPNHRISIYIANWVSQSFVGDWQLIGPHNMCPRRLSMLAEALAARWCYDHPCDQLWAYWHWPRGRSSCCVGGLAGQHSHVFGGSHTGQYDDIPVCIM